MHNRYNVTLTYEDGRTETIEKTPQVKIYGNRIYTWGEVKREWKRHDGTIHSYFAWSWTFRSLKNIVSIETTVWKE